MLRTDRQLRQAEETGSGPTIAALPMVGRGRRWRSFERAYWTQVDAVSWARDTQLAQSAARPTRRRVSLDPTDGPR